MPRTRLEHTLRNDERFSRLLSRTVSLLSEFDMSAMVVMLGAIARLRVGEPKTLMAAVASYLEERHTKLHARHLSPLINR